MKQGIVIGLICLNAALVVMLVFGSAAQPAYGQAMGASYLVISGHIGDYYDAVYIVDLANRRLSGVRYDKQSKRIAGLEPRGGRELGVDFNRAKAAR